MNRGRHEGETGIQILSYDNSLNTIEEEVYIPYSKSYAVLKDEMGQLFVPEQAAASVLFPRKRCL